MIPKTIHYCWFGGKPIPSKEKKCMESWKKFAPEYSIIKWDESNFNINDFPFAKKAYEQKKYAFVADFVRVYVLNQYGGVYLDTDVELIKPLDDLLQYEMFSGFECDNVIQTGIIGTIPYGKYIQIISSYYLSIVDEKFIPNSKIFANIFREQCIPINNSRYSSTHLELFPSEYFCPINQATQEIKTTPNTYCIHYLSGSWLPIKDRITRTIKRLLGNIFGFRFIEMIRTLK